MATTYPYETDLARIESAIYGEEVRESIVDGIRHCYENKSSAISQAEAAALKIDGMTAAASRLSYSATPTVTVSEVNGHKHVLFGIPSGEKGDKGEPFSIAKVFSSVAEMNSYTGSDVHTNDFVIITSNTEDVDNAKVFVKTANGYSFVTDMSGAMGIQGPKGDPGGLVDIKKTYASIAAMNADFNGTDVSFDDYVMISADVDDVDNAKVFKKLATGFAFVVDVSGPVGTRGPRGYTGATPQFSVGTVTTLPAGQPASATITGSDTAPVLNLSIPQGSQGPAGGGAIIDDTAGTDNNQVTWSAQKIGSYVTGKTPVMTGATASSAGAAGLVPPPSSGDQEKVLRGDGTWGPAVTEVDPMTGATSSVPGKAGLVPAPAAGDHIKVLFGSGVWGTIPSYANLTVNQLKAL